MGTSGEEAETFFWTPDPAHPHRGEGLEMKGLVTGSVRARHQKVLLTPGFLLRINHPPETGSGWTVGRGSF